MTLKRLTLTWLLFMTVMLQATSISLVRFKDVKTLDEHTELPPEKRGYVLSQGKDGIKVAFCNFKKNKTAEWPYVGVKNKDLKVRDWRNFPYLILTIRNHDKEISPTCTVVVRDDRNQLSTAYAWIRCNQTNKILIPLRRFKGQVDFSRIRLLQVAMPHCAYDVTLELIAAELTGELKKLDPNELIPRVFDVKAEMIRKKQGVDLAGETTLTFAKGYPYLNFKKYQKGMDKWPGLTLRSRLDDMLLDGDWSTKTHIYAELECVSGSISSLGFSLKDDERHNFWHYFGILPLKVKVVMDRMIYDVGLELNHMNSASLGMTMPNADGSARINAFRLEFRPDTLFKPVARKLQALLKQNLNENERKQTTDMQAALIQAYQRVAGEKARRKDIHDFIRRCEQTGKNVDGLLRENQLRLIRENMKDYPYGIGLADSMSSVFIDEKGFIAPAARKATLELARNEHESFQVVVIPFQRSLKNCRITVSPLKHDSGATLNVETALVGFAKTKRMTYPTEYTGWYPDFIISDQRQADIKPLEAVPFWVRIHADPKAPAGRYRAMITVAADGEKSYSFPLETTVWNFTVPPGAPFPIATNFGGLHVPYPKNTWQENDQLSRDFHELMARYRITFDRIYAGPYGIGNTAFECWKKLNDQGVLRNFCITNTTPRPDLTKDNTNPKDPGVEKLLVALKKHMKSAVERTKKDGYYDKAYFYGFDEGRVDAVTNRVFTFLKKNWPEIPIVTTASISSQDMPGIENIDVWVPATYRYVQDYSLVKELRKRGMKIWWYIANFPRPPSPTFLLEVPAIVPRLYMGAMTQKYRPEGFLYWATICWGRRQVNALVDKGPRTCWNPQTMAEENEEGNLFVAGKNGKILPSIRVENFRDGLEDLWYYRLLETLIKDREGKVAPELIAQAKRAVTVSEDLVAHTEQHTLDPRLLRHTRRNLARLIEALHP